jgi:hypothetical protein
MADAVDPVVPAVPSAPSSAGQTPGAGLASAVAGVLAIVLLDLAVESLLSASPVVWVVMGVEVVVIALLALLWTRLGPTTRVAIPLAGLAGTIVFATLRLGSGAEPGLRLATLTLPRIAVGLVIAATLVSAVLPFGFGILRRAWYLAAAFVLVALLSVIPLVRGLLVGASLSQLAGGAFDWTFLPAWLHGLVVATQVVVPAGLLAAVFLVIASVASRRRATWAVAGSVLLACALVAQAGELVRAGRSTFLAPVATPLLARLSAGPVVQGPPLPGAGTPGAAPAVPGLPGDATQIVAGPATAPPPGAVAVAQAGQPIVNKAIELRVAGHRTAPSIGGETAEPGREFVVVETAWKNILPQQKVNRKKATDRTAGAGSLGFGGGATARDRAQDDADSTIESVAFEVGDLPKHLWLVADGRLPEGIEVEATRSVQGHLGPDKITIPNFQQVVAGPIVFKAPAGAQALSILYLDSNQGHLLVPIKGAPPVLAGSLGGGSRANTFVDLALTGADFSNQPASGAGLRTFVLGLRGISRQNALVDVPFAEFGFLQTDQGCLVEPSANATGLTRQLAPMGRFLPFVPSEGQLAFEVPANSAPIAFLLRLQQGGPIDMPLKAGARPTWPSPEATITDGDVLRVLKLPGTAVPAEVSMPQAGNERVALDLVVENLRSGAGIDLQAQQQFRLVTPDGKRHEPIAESGKAPCRLGHAVVPAGSSRRFTLVYDVPPGQPLQMEYRGFAVQSQLVKVR